MELNKHLLSPLRRRRPAIYEQYGQEHIVAAFVQKRRLGVNTDTVELRNLSPIINIAFQEAGGPEAESDLDDVIKGLIENEEMSVSEAYEASVEMVVEAGKFAKQCGQIIQRYDRLIQKVETDEDRDMVNDAVMELWTALGRRLGR